MPATWQHLCNITKLQRNMIMLCRRYAAFTVLSDEVASASADITCVNHSARKAVEQADLALMSGCPYEMAEPLLTYASQHLSQNQEPCIGALSLTGMVFQKSLR